MFGHYDQKYDFDTRRRQSFDLKKTAKCMVPMSYYV